MIEFISPVMVTMPGEPPQQDKAANPVTPKKTRLIGSQELTPDIKVPVAEPLAANTHPPPKQ
jgi:hypothetical protein